MAMAASGASTLLGGAQGEAILVTSGLAVGYGGRAVVSGVDLSVRAGELVTLIGPNGAGKSTILRTVTGRLRPLAGEVFVGGRPLSSLDVRARAREVAVLLTEAVGGELMSASEVVEMGRYPYTGVLGIVGEEDRERVRAAMELVGIWDLRERAFARLSDGQRQLTLVARALSQDTRLIVLDEPTSHLDIRYQIELLGLLRRLARERGVAILMTLHELPLARRVSDRLLCIGDGRVLAEGTAAEVFRPEVIDELFDLEPGSYDARTGDVSLAGGATP